jgi:Rrf2 family protein
VRLTARSEYALLALVYLARRHSDGYVSVQNIAEAQKIPPKFLEQILLILKRARYVRSMKGQSGGYRLAKPASSVTVAEVIRLFDGPLAPTESVSRYFYESTPIEKEPRILKVLKQIRDHVSKTLEKTRISDVC